METIFTGMVSSSVPLITRTLLTKLNVSTKGYGQYAVMFIFLFLISFMRNIFCNVRKAFNRETLENYGWSAALWKGGIISVFCLICLFIVTFIPVVGTKYMLFFMTKPNVAEGIVILLAYLFSYVSITLPFVGGC
jgi:hypothetical protein